MDQQQIIERANQGIDFFNALTQRGAATALVVAALIGLGLSIVVKFPVHYAVKDNRMANWLCYLACIIGCFLASLLMWPEGNWRHTVGWSAALGLCIPLAWLILVLLIGLFSPKLKAALSLHRVVLQVPLDDEEESDARPSEPNSQPPQS